MAKYVKRVELTNMCKLCSDFNVVALLKLWAI